MSIKAIVVDDEELGRLNLQCALRNHPDWHVLALCESASEAEQVLDNNQVDVIFLDIHMPETSGIDLAKRLSKTNAPPVIIFVTAHSCYALHAFECFAMDYLLKPFSNTRLSEALVRAAETVHMRGNSDYGKSLHAYLEAGSIPQNKYLQQVAIRSLGEIELLSLDQVGYVSTAGNYVELHAKQGCKLLRVTMNTLEQKLDPAIFVRIHRGYIVRATHIVKLSNFTNGAAKLILSCGTTLPVSRAYLQTVKEMMVDVL
ncbi:response regulator transcription factor [Undibacterium seohonense]|uniref:Response regulator transcription factor n=1 Tax=Undibacterium seohonense TaxID=1344950 RepID=A0ABR6X4V3_9BURK|nr:LytTR family DNA-binding domain-containing protein [Undibacterium seohonense]MBC3807924.1 response regulator transcription factor [Undibacterium seohonense]